MDFNLKVTSKEDFVADMLGIGVDLSAWDGQYHQTDKAVVDWIGPVEGLEGLYVSVRTLPYQLRLSLPPEVAAPAAAAAGVPIYDYEKIIDVACVINQELDLSALPHCTVTAAPLRTFM